eukprot:gene10062-13552_t
MRGAAAAAALLATATPGLARNVAADKATIEAGLDRGYGRLDALYKDIHQNPELGFQETATAAKLAKAMRALGFEVTEGVGKTGIVAIYRNGKGPTVRTSTAPRPGPPEAG